MAKKILITGGSGLLALNWAMAERATFDVTLGFHTRRIELEGVATTKLSLETTQDLGQELEIIAPDIVVHTAGMTNIEECEAKPELAHFVNVDLAANVSRVCAEKGISQVHISTDHLFDGHKKMVAEREPVNPKNVYGKTKAEAEDRVRDIHPGALIVRTNFYGWGPTYRNSFSDIVVDTLRANKELTLFTDVYYTPILAEALANSVHHLVNKGASGIIHVSGDDRLSKYDFGCLLAKKFGLDSGLISPGKLSEKAELVQRPFDMSLSNAKLRTEFGIEAGGVEMHIDRLLQQEQSGSAGEIRCL